MAKMVTLKKTLGNSVSDPGTTMPAKLILRGNVLFVLLIEKSVSLKHKVWHIRDRYNKIIHLKPIHYYI